MENKMLLSEFGRFLTAIRYSAVIKVLTLERGDEV